MLLNLLSLNADLYYSMIALILDVIAQSFHVVILVSNIIVLSLYTDTLFSGTFSSNASALSFSANILFFNISPFFDISILFFVIFLFAYIIFLASFYLLSI